MLATFLSILAGAGALALMLGAGIRDALELVRWARARRYDEDPPPSSMSSDWLALLAVLVVVFLVMSALR